MIDFSDEELEPMKEPEGGWLKPCGFGDHQWGIQIEDGRVRLVCLDPCNLNETPYDPNAALPVCGIWWETEDLVTQDPIPVELSFVDDSSPSGPWGEAEYGFYIEVRAK